MKRITPLTRKSRQGTPETYDVADIIVTPASKGSGKQDLGGVNLQTEMAAEADSDLHNMYDDTF